MLGSLSGSLATPAILGIGVDIVHIPRIRALFTRRSPQRFASRILSELELADWNQLKQNEVASRALFLAVRWSLKEAAYKAMSHKLQPTWKEFTYRGVDNQRHMKPSLTYAPIRGESDSVGKIHCSVSHDGDYVFTTVLVEDASSCTEPSPMDP